MTVPARISLATLGVSDVARATAFYQALGWRLSPASQPGVVSFFHTAGGLLGLFGAAELAVDVADAGPPAAGGFRGVTLAINVADEATVDGALAAAVEAGGTLLKPGTRAEWGGYSGYFADPDGHAWEVAHNPGWPLNDTGLPELP